MFGVRAQQLPLPVCALHREPQQDGRPVAIPHGNPGSGQHSVDQLAIKSDANERLWCYPGRVGPVSHLLNIALGVKQRACHVAILHPALFAGDFENDFRETFAISTQALGVALINYGNLLQIETIDHQTVGRRSREQPKKQQQGQGKDID